MPNKADSIEYKVSLYHFKDSNYKRFLNYILVAVNDSKTNFNHQDKYNF